jgi:tRNA threonylcarbamoyladenosine biosynthesis protein TsaE
VSSSAKLLEIDSDSPRATLRFGATLGRCLRGGEVIGLSGDLGAGKTELVRGLARGLDIDPAVIYSPTFTLVAEHEGRIRLNHIDLFRLGTSVSPSDAEEIGLEDYLAPSGVTAIEWCGKLDSEAWTLEIDIELGEGEARKILVRARTPRGREIADELRRSWAAVGG